MSTEDNSNSVESALPQSFSNNNSTLQPNREVMNMQPLSFKPVGNSSSALNELIDLNELFEEEYYVPQSTDLSNFSTYEDPGLYLESDQLYNLNTQHQTYLNNAGEYSSSTGISPNYLPTQYVYTHQQNIQPNDPQSSLYATSSQPRHYMTASNSSRIPLSSDKIMKKNDVIMIPPTIPRIPSIPSSSSANEEDNNDNPGGQMKKKEKRTAEDDAQLDEKSNKFLRQSQGPTKPESKEISADFQRIERRERNREHAKRSRVRKKLLLDSLQDQLSGLRYENVLLRRVVAERIPQHAIRILTECTTEESSLLTSMNMSDSEKGNSNTPAHKPSQLTSNIAQNMLSLSNNTAPPSSSSRPIKQSAKILMEPDYRLMQSLVTSQQNFVLSDPSLPDNPIVYASEGFLKMTGYKRQDVLGRNCRFLQGPGTDQAAVDIIRQGIKEGRDISVCLLNYKADGKPFWNQFFLGALKDSEGQIVNYVGVQCEVNSVPVTEIKDRVKKLPIPQEL